MKPPSAAPFLSLRNVPLWMGVVLIAAIIGARPR